MFIRSRIIGLAAGLASLTVLAPTVRCEVLVKQSFEAVTGSELPQGPQPVGRISRYEAGEDGPLGSIVVSSVDTPAGPTRAATIGNVVHKENRAPGLLIGWTDPAAGTVRVEYRFMTPLDGPFYSAHYFGGDWNTSAAVFIIKDGQFTVQYGKDAARLSLGAYKAKEWHTIRWDFDVSVRTIDISLDGKQQAKKLAWQPGALGINRAEIFADFTKLDHEGAPVFYVDDILVETLGGTTTALAAPATRQSAVPLKGQSRSFRYGVCSHLRRYRGADYDKLLAAIDQLGVDIVRDGMDWNAIQPAEGVWNFDRLDKIVDDVGGRGVELQPLLAFSARWASTGRTDTGNWHDWNNRAPRIEPFKAYATAMVNRYKDRIHLWEIWNEPEISFWLSSPSEYVELFNAASAAVMRADPTAKVLNGGFALERRPPNMNVLQEFLPGADTTNWGIWAYHDYHTFPQMISRQKQNAALYKSKNASMPIWINEGGCYTMTPAAEPQQAITLAKKIATAPSLNIGAYIWYDLIDDSNDGNAADDPEHHFGLLHADFSPKPAFAAYQQVIRELSPLKFARRLPPDERLSGLWGLLYQATDAQHDDVLVLWREGKGRQTPLWVGPGGAGQAKAVYALDGTPVSAPQLGTGLLVSVSESPVYVHLRGSADPVVKSFLSLPDKLALLPGQDNPLRIQVGNPTDRPAAFTITVAADTPALRPTSQLPAVHLDGGKSASLAASIRLDNHSASAAKGLISVTLHPQGDAPAIEARVPYVVATAVPRLAKEAALDIPQGQGLLLRADTRDAIVNLYSAEPNPVMHWQGAADLSAVARIAYTQEALYLHVIATDDTHVQANHGSEIWRSDSLQFAVRADDSRPEYFEAGLALGDTGDAGKPQGWIYSLPSGSSLALGAMEKPITYDVKREGAQTHYIVRIPWKSLGNDGPPSTGFRMNFIVNDDDGHGRKGWAQLSDGIGKDQNADLFTLFVCN
jgi:hypothetical protein